MTGPRNFAWDGEKRHIRRELNTKLITTASPSVNKKIRKNAPARGSNPGPLDYKTSAYTTRPREVVC